MYSPLTCGNGQGALPSVTYLQISLHILLPIFHLNTSDLPTLRIHRFPQALKKDTLRPEIRDAKNLEITDFLILCIRRVAKRHGGARSCETA